MGSPQTHSFLSLQGLFRKILGTPKIEDDTVALKKRIKLEKEAHDAEIIKHIKEAEFLKALKDKFNRDRYATADDFMKSIDDDSWKKSLVLHVKEILRDKADLLHSDSHKHDASWTYAKAGLRTNMGALSVESFLQEYTSILGNAQTLRNFLNTPWMPECILEKYSENSQSSYRKDTTPSLIRKNFLNIPESYPESIIFRSQGLSGILVDRETIFERSRGYCTRVLQNIPFKALGYAKSIQEKLDFTYFQINDSLCTVKSLFLDNLDNMSENNSETINVPKKNVSMGMLFPKAHWSHKTQETSYANKPNSTNARADHLIEEQKAVQTLKEILRAKIDLQRISECEFLFTQTLHQ